MESMFVAAIQTNPRPGELDASIADHARLAIAAARKGAGLAVFPELSLTAYDRRLTRADALAPADPRLAPLQQIADAHGIVIVAGAPLAADTGLLIASFCFMPGKPAVIYSKQFLHAGEDGTFAPGTGGPALPIRGRTVCNAICAEITHPEHAQDAARQGANVYAASCFITPVGYDKSADLLRGYAHTHGMAVVFSNYGAPCGGWDAAGRSGVWSRAGELLAVGPVAGEAVVLAQLD